MSRSKLQLLHEALFHLDRATEYAQYEDEMDQLTIDAVCMRLSAGIEVLARLDPSIREQMFGESWQLMWGMRNRIAHGYILLDSGLVRQTIAEDLPRIIQGIRREMPGA